MIVLDAGQGLDFHNLPRVRKANHTSAEENNSPSSLRRLPTKKLSIQAVLEVVLDFDRFRI
jgi:hypothetical protein